jgi:lysophospholipase L1-like esterase
MDTRIDLHRYETEIQGLERAMAEAPPPPGEILFYGSSTMGNWRKDNLYRRHMAPLRVTNNGFGGSTAEEALYFYHRLVRPVRPSVMAYYEGPNDLSSKYTPAEILETTHRLFEWCRKDFPGIRFVILPVKFSPALAGIVGDIAILNDLYAQYAGRQSDTDIVDLRPVDFDEHGARRAGIYIEDNLHHTPAGYELLASLVRPKVEAAYRLTRALGPGA